MQGHQAGCGARQANWCSKGQPADSELGNGCFQIPHLQQAEAHIADTTRAYSPSSTLTSPVQAARQEFRQEARAPVHRPGGAVRGTPKTLLGLVLLGGLRLGGALGALAQVLLVGALQPQPVVRALPLLQGSEEEVSSQRHVSQQQFRAPRCISRTRLLLAVGATRSPPCCGADRGNAACPCPLLRQVNANKYATQQQEFGSLRLHRRVTFISSVTATVSTSGAARFAGSRTPVCCATCRYRHQSRLCNSDATELPGGA